MQSFARVTKLSNIGGRAAYITDPKRQEHIVSASPSVDWKPYQQYERNNQKTVAPNNEGREVIIALPNEWERLPYGELTSRAQTLAVAAVGKETDMQWAIHWNKSKSNLHMHVIFSERQKTGEMGRYDRDVYLTADGKIARSKAQRAKNADGSDKPPTHRKGDERGGFTAKDTQYKQKSWVKNMKSSLSHVMGSYGAIFEPRGVLYQYHEGKGRTAPITRHKNDIIKANNAAYEKFVSELPKKLSDNEIQKIKKILLLASQKGEVFQFSPPKEKEQVVKPPAPVVTHFVYKPKATTTPQKPTAQEIAVSEIRKALKALKTAVKKEMPPEPTESSGIARFNPFGRKEREAIKTAYITAWNERENEIRAALSTLGDYGVTILRGKNIAELESAKVPKLGGHIERQVKARIEEIQNAKIPAKVPRQEKPREETFAEKLERIDRLVKSQKQDEPQINRIKPKNKDER